MNVAITLPHRLSQAIISGTKTIEVRKSYPRHCNAGKDGFFVIEKGTDNVVCWCRVSRYHKIYLFNKKLRDLWFDSIGNDICISREEFHEYCGASNYMYLWYIDKTNVFSPTLHKGDLIIDKNPQSYCYTPLSYGESF